MIEVSTRAVGTTVATVGLVLAAVLIPTQSAGAAPQAPQAPQAQATPGPGATPAPPSGPPSGPQSGPQSGPPASPPGQPEKSKECLDAEKAVDQAIADMRKGGDAYDAALKQLNDARAQLIASVMNGQPNPAAAAALALAAKHFDDVRAAYDAALRRMWAAEAQMNRVCSPPPDIDPDDDTP